MAIYDDRLEITSAGSLHFGLTPEKLFVPHESRPWNPLIARAFHRRGIIEEWGHGTLKMTDLTSEAGLPMLEIEDDGWGVTVRFRHGQFVPQPVGSETSAAHRKQVILALLNNAGDGMARRDIIARMSPYAKQRQVTRDLETLRERGLITSSGHGGGVSGHQMVPLEPRGVKGGSKGGYSRLPMIPLPQTTTPPTTSLPKRAPLALLSSGGNL